MKSWPIALCLQAVCGSAYAEPLLWQSTTGHTQIVEGEKYAYGFMDKTEAGVRSFGHGGGAPGMNGELRIYPGSGYVIVVLANLDPPAASRPADFIGNRLPQ